MPICTKCLRDLDQSKFSKKSNSKTGHASNCKDCHNIYVREVWYRRNAQKQIESSAKWKLSNPNKVLAKRYNVSEDEISDLFESCKNRCEVCGSDIKLCVDHCHVTNRVRGILCHNCNTALGLMKENQEIILKLAEYASSKCEESPTLGTLCTGVILAKVSGVMTSRCRIRLKINDYVCVAYRTKCCSQNRHWHLFYTSPFWGFWRFYKGILWRSSQEKN